MAKAWMIKECFSCGGFCDTCKLKFEWEETMGIGEQYEREKTGRIEHENYQKQIEEDSKINPAVSLAAQFEIFYGEVARELVKANPAHAGLTMVGKLNLIREIIKEISNPLDCVSGKRKVEHRGGNPIHKEFYDLITQIVDTFERKNHDYAGSDAQDMMQNFMRCENFGIKMSDGIITRMSDKITRMENLLRTRTQKVTDESLIDTVTDLANYCLLLVIALKRESKVIVKDVREDGQDFSCIEERG